MVGNRYILPLTWFSPQVRSILLRRTKDQTSKVLAWLFLPIFLLLQLNPSLPPLPQVTGKALVSLPEKHRVDHTEELSEEEMKVRLLLLLLILTCFSARCSPELRSFPRLLWTSLWLRERRKRYWLEVEGDSVTGEGRSTRILEVDHTCQTRCYPQGGSQGGLGLRGPHRTLWSGCHGRRGGRRQGPSYLGAAA